MALMKQSTGETPSQAMGHQTRQGSLLSQAMGHQTRQGSLLCDLDGKGFPFCSPMTTEMVHERSAVVMWFSQRWVMVTAVFGEALAPATTPAVVVTTGGPPPRNNSAREVLVWRVDGASSSGNGG
jgi:hypothetical protein